MRDIILNTINNSIDNEINLEDLNIADEELEEIITEIKQKRPNIEELYLNNNQISDRGAALLGALLADLAKLSILDLQFNSIDIEGATAVFTLKKFHPKMQIALHGNKIDNVDDMIKIEQKYK